MEPPRIDPWTYRCIGLGGCMLGSAMLVLAVHPGVPSVGLIHPSPVVGLVVRVALAFAAWCAGLGFIAWPELRRKRA